MGQPKAPRPVKLVMSLIMGSETLFQEVRADLRSLCGEIDFESPWMAFDFTDYYAPEMGENLKRRMIAFRRLIQPDALSVVKGQTNRIERTYTDQGKRRVNIDPGYVSAHHLILGTTKAYTHRPYLRDGIYADLTLIYRKGSFRALEWTYPDYRRPEMVEILGEVRRTYLAQLTGRAE